MNGLRMTPVGWVLEGLCTGNNKGAIVEDGTRDMRTKCCSAMTHNTRTHTLHFAAHITKQALARGDME